MKKFIISGIMPSNYGVGRVMRRIVAIGKEKKYKVLFPLTTSSISPKLKSGKILDIFLEIKNRLLNIKYNYLLKHIKNSKVIIIHIQTVGFDNIFRLLENKNRLSIYVMDNSFFCIKSYNHIKGEFTECLKCINDSENCMDECHPYPIAYKKDDNFRHLKLLKKHAKSIMFLVQNVNQAELLKKFYGNEIEFKIVGLKTNEFENFDEIIKITSDFKYDIVFHGAAVEAKGLKYVLEIAKKLPDVNFLIPENRENCNITEEFKNVEFQSMQWETGLREAVQNCKLVMCPSIWSAPIEGAVVKSIIYNGNIALYDAHCSYANEIPDDCVLKMNSDIENSAIKVNQYLQNELYCYTKKSKKYMKDYLDKYDLSDVLS